MKLPEMFSETEKPLENIVKDGGFCAIFRSIVCVGDSLSSGEFELIDGEKHGWYDKMDYSWGQFIARKTGAKVYNYSRGGMTAKEYIESFAEEKDFWNDSVKPQAYIFALGVNDLFGKNQPVGDVGDFDKNNETFANYFERLIRRYKAISPKSFFFFVTMPMENDDKNESREQHSKLMYAFAEKYEKSFVIDLHKYGPYYDDEFKKAYYLNGHMNACGYLLTADMISSYIDYIVRKNPSVFNYIGLMDETN